MSAYYNEFDAGAAAWLRELIRRGLIADGEVDERSILDVSADDLFGFTQCHFFAGIGGWSLALRMAGWPDDVPVWTGSPPCQPFSAAGQQKGKDDERHLAPHFATLVAAGRPRFLFGEQVASAAVFGKAAKRAGGAPDGEPGWAWIDDLFGRLEAAHYACGASDIPAAGIGAPHIRQRTFFGAVRLADAASGGHQPRQGIARIRGSDFGENASTEQRGAVCSVGRLADADGGQSGEAGGLQSSRQYGLQPQGGGSGGLGDTQHTRLEGQLRHGDDRHEPGRVGADAPRPTAEAGDAHSMDDRGRPGAAHGGWDTPDWLFCRDGKWRPVIASHVTLLDGLPDRVVRGGNIYHEAEEGEVDGTQGQANTGQVLPSMRDEDGAQENARQTGGSQCLQPPRLLQPGVHGRRDGKGGLHKCLAQPVEGSADGGSDMRNMRARGEDARPSLGREPFQQRPIELEDLVSELSSQIALAQLHGRWRDASAMQALREAIQKEWAVPHTSVSPAEAWASLGEESKNRIRVDHGARWCRVTFHPLSSGERNRTMRLRGYGNAIVPAVASQFIQAFMQALSRADI